MWRRETLDLMRDGYVPVRLAADGLGRSVRTIRTWIAAGVIGSVSDPAYGVLVRIEDVLEAHATRGKRRRTSAKVAA